MPDAALAEGVPAFGDFREYKFGEANRAVGVQDILLAIAELLLRLVRSSITFYTLSVGAYWVDKVGFSFF